MFLLGVNLTLQPFFLEVQFILKPLISTPLRSEFRGSVLILPFPCLLYNIPTMRITEELQLTFISNKCAVIPVQGCAGKRSLTQLPQTMAVY